LGSPGIPAAIDRTVGGENPIRKKGRTDASALTTFFLAAATCAAAGHAAVAAAVAGHDAAAKAAAGRVSEIDDA